MRYALLFMIFIGLVLFAAFCFHVGRICRTRPPQFYYHEVTAADIAKTAEIAEKTIRSFPDTPIAEYFPEAKYKILGERYAAGKITKLEYRAQVDNILLNLKLSSKG